MSLRIQIQSLLLRVQLDKQKVVFILIVMLLFVYVDLAFLVRGQLAALSGQRPQITRLKKDIEELTKELARLKEARQRQMEVRQRVMAHAKKVITDDQIARLLQLISEMATKNGIRISEMRPMKEPAAKDNRAAGTLKAVPLAVHLAFTGDYHRIGAFINDLENAEIFMAVQNLTIAGDTGDYLLQRAVAILLTYVKQ